MAQFLMERSQNPFTPAAGKMPPVLVGRESLICDFEEALDNGAGAPGRLMLISGQLGFGKTVMLAELGRRAESTDGPCFPIWHRMVSVTACYQCLRNLRLRQSIRQLLRSG